MYRKLGLGGVSLIDLVAIVDTGDRTLYKAAEIQCITSWANQTTTKACILFDSLTGLTLTNTKQL